MPENTPTQDQEAMEERQALAQHIINCLSPHGMRGLKLMTGAGPFALEKNGISFRFKGSPKANHAKITLNGKDLFDVVLTKIKGTDCTTVFDGRDLYDDALEELFRSETGLETKVPTVTETPQ